MQPSRAALKKLLGQPADAYDDSSPSFDHHRLDHRAATGRSAIYQAGGALTCVDDADDQTHAVIAGGRVFKIVRVDGSSVVESLDIRASLSAWASANNDAGYTSAHQLDIRAVKWAQPSKIVTASGNGSITAYDINALDGATEIERVNKHTRIVHQLDVSPHRNNWLLSASQDSIVRQFDMRMNDNSRPVQFFKNRISFKCNSGAIRDVKWALNDGFVFACASDEGTVLKWDVRRSTAPLMKINAHEGPCWTISWHPDAQYLISGGADHRCKVWDLSESADRRQKPRWTVRTPAAVTSVSWRPPYRSVSGRGYRAAQVAVTYDDRDAVGNLGSTIHIWDLARPGIPFKELTDIDVTRNGLLWRTRNILWTAGKSGEFTQSDVSGAPRVIDRRSLSTFDFAASGEMAMLLEKRPRQRRPRLTHPSSMENLHQPNSFHSQSPDLGDLSPSGSYEDSEEEVVGSFLQAKSKHNRRNSTRSSISMSSTPPTGSITAESRLLKLEDAVNLVGVYQPQQVMAIGRAPTTMKRNLYQYLTNSYLLPLASDTPEARERGLEPLRVSTPARLELYAQAAEGVNQFRLAQTWRLMAYIFGLLLMRRAQYHRDARLEAQEKRRETIEKRKKHQLKEKRRMRYHRFNGEDTPRLQENEGETKPRPQQFRSILAEEIESSSNVPTPVARPADQVLGRVHGQLPLPDGDFHLPPSAHSPSGLSPSPNSGSEPASSNISPATQTPTAEPIEIPGSLDKKAEKNEPILEGYDFYGLESITRAIDIAPPKRKTRLDYDRLNQNHTRTASSQRRDSMEDLDMFSMSSDSTTKFAGSSMSSDRDPIERWRQRDERHEVSFAADGWGNAKLFPSSHGSGQVRSSAGSSGRYGQLPLPPALRIQEASVPTSNPERFDDSSETIQDDLPDEPVEILESDYLPAADDPSFLPPPLNPSALVQRTIDHETLTSVIHAAAMVLVIRPLLPEGSLDPYQATAILKQYHARLESLTLYTEANLLRNLVQPDINFYPTTKYLNDIHFFCTDCQKPLEDNAFEKGHGRCDRCRGAMDGCVVCLGTDAPIMDDLFPAFETDHLTANSYQSAVSNLWMWCQGCGHGGHQACLRLWHAGPDYEEGSVQSDGMCPLQGCLHDCIPGKWRDQLAAEGDEEMNREVARLVREPSAQSQRSMRSVRRDSREVVESRAVAGARESLLPGSNTASPSPSVAIPVPGRKSSVNMQTLARSPRFESRGRRSLESDQSESFSNSV